MSKNIFIFTNKEEINYAINKWDLKDDKNLIVPWTIDAIDLLIEKKLSYTVPSTFTSKSTPVTDDLYIFRLKEFKKLLYILDTIINKYKKEPLLSELTYFTNIVYRTRRSFYSIFEEIDNLYYLLSLKPKNIYVFYKDKMQKDNAVLELIDCLNSDIEQKYNFTKIKYGDYFSENTIKIEELNEYSLMKNSIISSFINYLKNNIKFLLKKAEYRITLINNLFPRTFSKLKKNKKNILILLANGNELPKIINTIQRDKTYNLLFWENIIPKFKSNFLFKINLIKEEINNNQNLRNICKYKDINFFELVKKNIIFPNLNHYLLTDMVNNKINFEMMHHDIGIDLVITSNEFPVFEEIFNSCEKLSIPRIDFLHGGTVGFSLTITLLKEYFRKGGRKHYKFVYTEEIIKFQNKYKNIFNINQNYISIGSTKYNQIHSNSYLANKSKNYFNILYIIGPINNHSLFQKGVMDDVWHVNFINNIIDISKKNKEINFYIKLGYDLQNKIINILKKINEIDNIHLISTSKSAVETYDSMDLVLLDSLSTSFFEVASTKLPILMFYDKTYEVDPLFEEVLRKRAIVADTEGELYLKLSQSLEIVKNLNLKNTDNNITNDLYYKYCNPKNTNSSSLAIKKIDEIIATS